MTQITTEKRYRTTQNVTPLARLIPDSNDFGYTHIEVAGTSISVL